MKKLITIIFLGVSAFSFGQSDVYVEGYYKNNGDYVEPHYRTAPNNTAQDNYSTYPNVNPYTGEIGTKYAPTNRYTASPNTSSSSTKDVYVDGYYRNNGTYVKPHYRSK